MFLKENVSRIGCHCSFNASKIIPLYELGYRTFQVFIGSPQRDPKSYDDLMARYLEEKRRMPEDIQIVVHGPYWYNFVKNDWLTRKTVESICSQLRVASAIGAKRYVTHNGYRYSQKDLERGFKLLQIPEAMDNWIKTTIALIPALKKFNMRICYENTPGCRAGTAMGTVDELLELVRYVSDYEYVGYTYDTEHAWANGEAAMSGGKEKFFEDVVASASVVHLNGAPARATFGSHLDRHSTTLIQESVGITPKRLKRVMELARCPIILERDQSYCLARDIQWARSLVRPRV